MRYASVLLLSLFLAACSGTGTVELPVGPDVTVRGTVDSIDREPMAVDSDAIITLQSAEGEMEVLIPARPNLCEAEGLDLFAGLVAGASIEVRGQSLAGGGVRPCLSKRHFLRMLNP